MQENEFDLQLTSEQTTQVIDAINVLKTVLMPRLKVLNKDEKRDLLFMGDKSVAFVEKALEVTRQEINLLGAFIDEVAFENDVNAINTLRSFEYQVSSISSAIDDSYAIAGSEAYKTALMVYSLMKNAAKMGQPGATEKVEELSARFPGRKRTARAN
jgi:hypothetical protein